MLTQIVNLDTNSAFIISSGNCNIAMYKLKDKLDGSKFHYHGNFDPEGLLIANKLKCIYKNFRIL